MADNATTGLPARLPGPAGIAQIPGVRQLLLLLGIAAAIAIGITVAVWSRSPVMAPLYTGLDERDASQVVRSEEHTSELQSLMRISYAVFCLKKKTQRRR